MNPSQTNTHFKYKADSLLAKYGLLKILSDLGAPQIVGSYAYDLMAWKELDLILEIDELNLEFINTIISKIKQSCNPTNIKTANHLTDPKHGSLYGFWIGIYIEGWKIDAWVLDKNGIAKQMSQMVEIKQMITPEYQDIIITIKNDLANDPDYHKRFSSVGLYDAVCKSGIKTTDEFYTIVKNK